MYQIEVVHNGSTATKKASTINELTTWFNLTNQIDKLLNQDDIVGLSIDGTPLSFSVTVSSLEEKSTEQVQEQETEPIEE